MADYTGTSPVGPGIGNNEQIYTEIKWNNGNFYIENSDGTTSIQSSIINADHRKPSYTVKFALDSSKQLTVTFIGTSSIYDYFEYPVGYEAWDDDHKNDVIRERTAGNWAWGHGNAGVNAVFKKDLSKLKLPIYVRAICQGCSSNKSEMAGFAFYSDESLAVGRGAYKIIQAHTHIEIPNKPIISSTSGTTITVSCNPNDSASDHLGQVRDMNQSNWYDSAHIFTNYDNNEEVLFKSRRYCSDDCINDYKYFVCDGTTEAVTWSITGDCVAMMTNELSFSLIHYPGTSGGLASDTKIVCNLYGSIEDSNNNENVISSKETTSGSTVTFTNLKPDTTYYCKAWSKNIVNENGEADNVITIEAMTAKTFSITKYETKASATTIMASATWESNASNSVTCIVTCNGKELAITASGNKVGFINLDKNRIYAVTYKFKDSNNNTITKQTHILTRKATIVPVDRSSKIIIFKSKSNRSSDTMQLSINSSSWSNIAHNTNKLYNNLTHNTNYTLNARIKDCFAYNIAGEITSENDSIESYNWSTLLLSVSAKVLEEHQHNIVCIAQAYINNVSRDEDYIDNTKFKFTNLKTRAVGENNYQNNSIAIYDSNGISKNYLDGVTTGDYQLDKKVYSNDLTYYYCRYEVDISVSDGYNKASTTVICHTSFPYCRIFVDGKWHKAMTYVFNEGKWIPAPALIYNNNKWNELNGEDVQTSATFM